MEPFDSDVVVAPHVSDRPATIADRVDDAFVRLDELRNHRSLAISGSLVVLLLVAVGWWSTRTTSRAPVENLIPQVGLSVTTASGQFTPDVEVVVHVVGEVARPGVYRLDSELRIHDAIAASGGPTVDGDIGVLNLAAPLVDGSQIRVPAIGEQVTSELVTGPSSTTDGGPIDINTADARQLESLPGVGPATSAAIIEFRDRAGPFLSVEDLLEVPGIGPAKLASLIENVVVG